MRYFLYCRKSSDREDKQILGPEAQRRIMLEHARTQGLAVVDVFVEQKSAYKIGRPLFGEMLRRIEAGEADGILTYHLTRLARNSFDGGRLIYMMDEGAVGRIVTPERAYTDNADDKFLMQIHFAMAKKSSDDTSQFVRRDVVSKLLKGEYPGMVPLGYLNINRDGHITRAQDDLQKYLKLQELGRPLRREEIDPIDGPLVRKLFEEVARGRYSQRQLRTLSFRLGLRTRKGAKLSKNALMNLLRNPYYHGVIRYGGTVYDTATIREQSGNPTAAIQHEPLISRTLFEQVQEELNSRRKGRYRKHSYTFGGCLIRCGECDAPVTAERQKGQIYYHCTGNRGACTQTRWTREDRLEEQFLAVLANLRLPEEYLDFALEQIRRAHALEVKTTQTMRQKLQSQQNAAVQKLDRLLQLKISAENADGGLLSDAEYLREKARLRQESDLLQEQLATLQRQGAGWIDDCERFFRFTQMLARNFAARDVEVKKTLLNLVCSNLTLRDRILAVEYREPYATLAGFPLAGKGEDRGFEPESALAGAKHAEISANWLHLLTAIRTYPLRAYAASLALP